MLWKVCKCGAFLGRKLTLILTAYHTLVEKGILHRDISENNVLINLVGDDGILIDLDMSKDLEEPEDASKFKSSTLRIFPVRASHGQHPAQTSAIDLTPSAVSSMHHSTDVPLEQDLGTGAREPITVCSYD
jgi:serine/threonine protein kinase